MNALLIDDADAVPASLHWQGRALAGQRPRGGAAPG